MSVLLAVVGTMDQISSGVEAHVQILSIALLKKKVLLEIFLEVKFSTIYLLKITKKHMIAHLMYRAVHGYWSVVSSLWFCNF